jgi:hypothetical protein
VDKRKYGKYKQIENIMCKEPSKSFNHAVMWKCEFIGVIGQSNNRIHQQLSKILKGQDFFIPYSVSGSLIFHDHGDPSDMSIDERANVRHSLPALSPFLAVLF